MSPAYTAADCRSQSTKMSSAAENSETPPAALGPAECDEHSPQGPDDHSLQRTLEDGQQQKQRRDAGVAPHGARAQPQRGEDRGHGGGHRFAHQDPIPPWPVRASERVAGNACVIRPRLIHCHCAKLLSEPERQKSSHPAATASASSQVPAVGLDRRADAVRGPLPEGTPQPFALRRLQRPLRAPRRPRPAAATRDPPQHPLARLTRDLALRRLPQRELDQPVVQERLAQLTGRAHGDRGR